MSDLETRPTTMRLRRSREDRVIAGVCGGLGNYLGVDPIWLRIAFVAMAVGAGSGVLLYIISWIVMPEVPAGDIEYRKPRGESAPGGLFVGALLIVLGVIALADRLVPWLDDFIWPGVLIAIGAGLVLRGMSHD